MMPRRIILPFPASARGFDVGGHLLRDIVNRHVYYHTTRSSECVFGDWSQIGAGLPLLVLMRRLVEKNSASILRAAKISRADIFVVGTLSPMWE